MARLKVILADDEPAGRVALRRALEQCGGVDVIAEAANGLEALEAIERERPDVAFLDIEMPGMTGLEVAANLSATPRVVFVTAYDEYAVKAFDANALDYVLKPFRVERLAESLQRARAGSRAAVRAIRPFRLAVRKGRRIVLLSLRDVLWAGLEDKLCFVYTGEGRYLCDRTIAELDEMLGAAGFFRVSRSAIVNLEHVLELAPMLSGTWQARLRGGAEVDVSRERARDLKSLLGL